MNKLYTKCLILLVCIAMLLAVGCAKQEDGGTSSVTNPDGSGGKTDTAAYYALTIESDADRGTLEAKVGGAKITDLTKIKKGTIVELVATPKSGYKLKDFTGANTANGKTTVTMDCDKTVKANFDLITLKCSPVPEGDVNAANFDVTYKIGDDTEKPLPADGVIPLKNATDNVVIKVAKASGFSDTLKYNWKKNGNSIDGVTADTTDNITVTIEGNEDITIELTVSK